MSCLRETFWEWSLKMEVRGIEVVEEADDSILVGFGAGEKLASMCHVGSRAGLWWFRESITYSRHYRSGRLCKTLGAYGVEINQVFHSLEAYEIKTGKIVRFYNEDCKFGYRYSVFKGPQRDKYIITRVYLRLSKKAII